jgi:hypothetical protein
MDINGGGTSTEPIGTGDPHATRRRASPLSPARPLRLPAPGSRPPAPAQKAGHAHDQGSPISLDPRKGDHRPRWANGNIFETLVTLDEKMVASRRSPALGRVRSRHFSPAQGVVSHDGTRSTPPR